MSDIQKQKGEAALREETILAFWNDRDIFRKSLEKDAPKGEYVFYDGPPFATGLPHHGHMLPSTIKDAIPRYRTMQGYRVERKWGWDCHGLPLENLIEKKLGLKTKRDIEELGIEAFNQTCADAVMEYADDWKKIIPRIGRWADMDDDYKTMDATYTESVWWVFSELNRKGLVYEGFKSMHLCPRCGTTLSNFEVNQGYKDIKDIAVTVKLPLLNETGEVTDTSLLVWTTTPWTLPGNMAAAVHGEYDYVIARQYISTKNDVGAEEMVSEKVIIAKEILEKYSSIESSDGSKSYAVSDGFLLHPEKVIKGADLVGRSYVPPFEYYKDIDIEHKENAWKIYHADYVTLESGTGAVHLAPAYGEEDMALAQEKGIPVVHHVDQNGSLMPHITDLSGRAVKPKDDQKTGVLHTDLDVEILKLLTANGRLFRKENIVHSYPHCWRCDTPLLNYATSSWFVKVTDIRDKLVAQNKTIGWVPEHVGSARFGNWLEGARDWAVSRQRYWGAPLPVWRNKKANTYKVFGSLAEIKNHVKKSGNEYLLMRHGEAESNAADVVSTEKDAHNPLTEKGKEQVRLAGKQLSGKKIDFIFHSGYMRTKETAHILQEVLGLPAEALVEDDRLGEMRIGPDFEGKTWAEYNARFATWEERYTKKVGDLENRRDVQKRLGAFLYDIDERYKDKTILIVSHAGPLFGLECASVGADIEKAWEVRQATEYFTNAEVRPLSFTQLPHNQNFELDYHRPYIDQVPLVDVDGEPLERVQDVFDCWFESGSMPYGQQHYPFENRDVFDPGKQMGYPADFISESVDQTRGWFYSMIVLGTALFGISPYKNVITNGLVLAEDGRKMSKSLKNYPDLMDVVDAYGADTLRFFLLSSQVVRGEDVNFSEKSLAELGRKNIGRLANVLSFYDLYKDRAVSRVRALDSRDVLDQWILARLSETLAEVTEGMESYELDRATRPISGMIDDLSVWYVRRSRERMKYGASEEQEVALATLRHALYTLAHIIAPSMPFFAEHLFLAVREEGDAESVHLSPWPSIVTMDAETKESTQRLLENMRHVRDIVTEGLEARNEAGIKVRQPLASFTVPSRRGIDNPALISLIAEELNIKEIKEDSSLPAPVLDVSITEELREEGDVRELMRFIQDVRKTRGLLPHDVIALSIMTTPEGEVAVRRYKDLIMRTVQASDIHLRECEGEVLTVSGASYTISF